MNLLELENREVKLTSHAEIKTSFGIRESAYPRPQFQRTHWQSLNGLWKFAFDDEGKCVQPSDLSQWTHDIEVPFAPESTKSGIGDTGFHPNCWYEREFETPPGEGRLLLHFGAVDYRARVWVNDQYIAEHEGGHTGFTLDITHVLNDSGKTKVTVWAQDDPHDLAKPRGKQDWQLEPHSIWYPRTSGIWQTVWVERVGTTYIDHIQWTPDFERWELGCYAALAGNVPVSGVQIKMKLSVGDRMLVNDTYEVFNGEVSRRLALCDPGIDDYRNKLLWSPEKPTLIDAELEVWYKGELLDQVKTYTAMRTVSIQRDRFMLNGRPYYLRLVLDQGYWHDSFMTAPDDEALRRDVELAKAMGFNGVRKHQKIEDPRFLYWADVLGLLVWEEMPSAYRFSPKAVERTTKEWTEVIKRDINHPCIVAWVPFNESWGVPNLVETQAHRNYVLAMYHLTKTLDPTRPVIGNDGWESTDTDILAIHDYDTNPQHLANRYGPSVKLSDLFDRKRPGGRILTLDNYPHQGQPVMLTEFGGIAYAPENKPDANKIWGYERSWNLSELQMKYAALLESVNNIEIFSGFCYTQFTDTFQEANGLLYADRTPKFPIEAIRAATLSGRLTLAYGEYYLIVSEEVQPQRTENQGRVVALDPGVRTFMTFFSELSYGWLGNDANLRIQKLCFKLDKLISQISKAKSQQRQRLKKSADRLRAKIQHMVKELHHKSARFLVDNFDVILLPSFESSQMVSKSRRKIRAKSVRQMLTLSHYQFKKHLEWKAWESGKVALTDINEAYTSKTVSWTGEIVRIGGSRIIKSKINGSRMNRDLNGARGIFLRALVDTPWLRKHLNLCIC